MPDFAVVTAFKGTDRMSPVFKKMSSAADKFGNKASGAFNRASKAGIGLRTRMKDIAGGIISASLIQRGTRAVWDFTKGSIELASSLAEVQNVVDTTFGVSAKEINQFAKTAIRDFGLSELQAKQFTGSLGAMMKSSGITGKPLVEMSSKLSAVAGDFASFYNLPIEEAFEKIRSGISGETEPLKRLGINMNVANMEAYALTQGINKKWKAMTQAEQTILRYNYLMKVSADAQGDFSKTLKDSYANQKRVFQTMVQQTAARAMSKVLPLLTQGLAKLNEMLAKVNADKLGNGLRKIIDGGIWLIQTLYKLRFVILAAVSAFAAYKIILGGVFVAQKIMMLAGWVKYLVMMRSVIWKAITATKAWAVVQKILNVVMSMNPIGLIIIGVAALIALIVVLIKNWDKFGKTILFILGPIGWVVNAIMSIKRRWNDIVTAFKAGGIKAALLEIGKTLLDSLLHPIQKILEVFAKIPGVGKFAAAGAEKLKSFRENYLGAVKEAAAVVSKTNANTERINMASTNVNSPSGKDNRTAPNETEVKARRIDFQGRIDIAGAPKNTEVKSQTRGAPAILLQLLGAQ